MPASRVEVRLHGDHVARSHGQGPGPLDHAPEDRVERLGHHLRRPALSRPAVTQPPQLHRSFDRPELGVNRSRPTPTKPLLLPPEPLGPRQQPTAHQDVEQVQGRRPLRRSPGAAPWPASSRSCDSPPSPARWVPSGPARTGLGRFLQYRIVGLGGSLTEAQWARIEPLLPDRTPGGWAVALSPAGDRRDRVRVRTGTPWTDLPEHFGSWQGAHSRLRKWSADGTWQKVFIALLAPTDAEGDLDWVVAVDSPIVRAH